MDQTPPAMTISEFRTKIQRRGNAKLCRIAAWSAPYC